MLIDLEGVAPDDLPEELAVSAVTMAELAAGPHATTDPDERARRQDRLQRAEATFDPLPVDAAVARAYGRIYVAAAGARSLDLLIAARRSRPRCRCTRETRMTSGGSSASSTWCSSNRRQARLEQHPGHMHRSTELRPAAARTADPTEARRVSGARRLGVGDGDDAQVGADGVTLAPAAARDHAESQREKSKDRRCHAPTVRAAEGAVIAASTGLRLGG